MLVTILEAALGVVGLGLVALGIYGVVRDKFGSQTSGGAFGGNISIPLSGLIIILGLGTSGFAAYLAANGTAKTPAAAPPAEVGTPAGSPTRVIPASPVLATSPPVTGTPTAVPMTLSCSLSQERLRPGVTVQLTYHIDSPVTRQVGLGAGLYDEQANDHSNGDGDISSFTLERGQNSPSRPVTIPGNLPAGKYELDAEIWPANKIGQNHANDLIDARCAFFNVP